MFYRKLINILKVLLLSFLVGLISCNKFDELKSPVDGFKVLLNYDIFDTFITVKLIDVASGQLIGALDDEKIEVQITGKSAGAVVDQLGNHSTEYNSVYGILSLALNPKDPWIPSPENLVELNFEASGERFKTTDIEIRIDSTGSHTFSIFMEQTNVEKLGVKKYTFILPLNNGKLAHDFLFETTGNEIHLEIPECAEFIDSEGKPISGKEIKMNLKIFLNQGKTPVSTSLINNLKNLEGVSSKMAMDFYSTFELSFFSETEEKINEIGNCNIIVKNRIQNKPYYTKEKRSIQKGDKLFSYNYNLQTKYWEENEEVELQSDSSGFFFVTEFNNFSVKASGNSTNTCNLTGSVKFNFTNEFSELPIGARINLYRKRDNRYIGNQTFQIENNNQIFNFSLLSIENEPIRFYVYNQSSYNPFTANPANFYPETSCNALSENLEIAITSNRTQLNGILKINYENELPPEGLEIYTDIYNTSNNARMYRKKFTLNQNDTVLNITTGIIADQEVYLKIVPVRNFHEMLSTPEKMYFNTSDGPFIWETNLSTKDISSEFVFEFDISEDFSDRELWVRADYFNRITETIEESVTFKISKNNSTIVNRVVLTEGKAFRVNLKRLEGKEHFMAFPFRQYFTSKNGSKANYTAEILPVQKEMVEANLQLICGSSIIYPSINSMFRTVWDDKWTDIEIKDGHFSTVLEIGATYQIGTIFEGELVSTEYEITTTNIDLSMEMEGGFCDDMGW